MSGYLQGKMDHFRLKYMAKIPNLEKHMSLHSVVPQTGRPVHVQPADSLALADLLVGSTFQSKQSVRTHSELYVWVLIAACKGPSYIG